VNNQFVSFSEERKVGRNNKKGNKSTQNNAPFLDQDAGGKGSPEKLIAWAQGPPAGLYPRTMEKKIMGLSRGKNTGGAQEGEGIRSGKEKVPTTGVNL